MALSETEITAAFRRGPHYRINVGHSQLAAWRFGSGPDVVFIHGWPLHAATFRRVVAVLADRYTCHLFDLPGAGATETTDPSAIALDRHVATARAAIDTLMRDPIHGSTNPSGGYALIAHDSGGLIARAIAADDPRVRGVVLGNTEIPGHMPFLVLVYMLMAKLPGGTAIVRRMLGSRWLRRSPLVFGGCFADTRAIEGEFTELFVQPMVRSKRIAAAQMRLAASINKGQVAGLVKLHQRIRAPVQLIWGVDDPFFPLARARGMVDQFAGGATLHEIPRAKLFVHEERAAEFAALAHGFLERSWAGEPAWGQLPDVLPVVGKAVALPRE